MLLELRLDDWKSFGSGEHARNSFELSPLTLLVGPNGSGKSNVLDALRFLQGLALDLPIGEVLRGRWEGGREIWPPIRGGQIEAARAGAASFGLTLSAHVEPSSVLTYAVQVSALGEPSLDAEHLKDENGAHYFDTHAPSLGAIAGRQPGGSLNVALRSTGQGRSTTQAYSSVRSVLGQVEPAGRIKAEVIEQAHLLRRLLREMLFLDVRPSRMRDYVPQHQRELGVHAENVSAVLHELSKTTSGLDDVLDWVAELCAPALERIEFEETRLGDVMFVLIERGGRRISARSISDGTLRFLGEVLALLSTPSGSVLLIEEPDVGLHPSRIHLLAELLEQVTTQRNVQVIATTHSPTLLSHLSAEALGNVVAFGRDAQTGLSVCSVLGNLPHFERLRDSDQIERLVSTGWVERAL